MKRREQTAGPKSSGVKEPGLRGDNALQPGARKRLADLIAAARATLPPQPPDLSPEELAEWGRRLAAIDARVAAQTPPGVTPEEIEAEITAAADEVRRSRLARRR